MNLAIDDDQDKQRQNGFPVASKFIVPSTITELDNLLNKGGLQNGRFTEIVGEKNCGKTSLALQFCLTVQLPPIVGGPAGEAIYISTKCNIARLSQMVERFIAKWNSVIYETIQGAQMDGGNQHEVESNNNRPYFNVDNVLGKIGMYVCPTFAELLAKLHDILKILESNTRIKVIVIDGIGSPTGNVDDNLMKFKDQVAMFKPLILNLLYHNKTNVSVIVTNTKQVDNFYSAYYVTPMISSYYYMWFPLCQMIQMKYDAEQKKGCIRLVRTIYNESGEGFADFVINDDGVCDDPEYVM